MVLAPGRNARTDAGRTHGVADSKPPLNVLQVALRDGVAARFARPSSRKDSNAGPAVPVAPGGGACCGRARRDPAARSPDAHRLGPCACRSIRCVRRGTGGPRSAGCGVHAWPWRPVLAAGVQRREGSGPAAWAHARADRQAHGPWRARSIRRCAVRVSRAGGNTLGPRRMRHAAGAARGAVEAHARRHRRVDRVAGACSGRRAARRRRRAGLGAAWRVPARVARWTTARQWRRAWRARDPGRRCGRWA